MYLVFYTRPPSSGDQQLSTCRKFPSLSITQAIMYGKASIGATLNSIAANPQSPTSEYPSSSPEDQNNEVLPPAYTATSNSSLPSSDQSVSRRKPTIPGLPALPFDLYTLPHFSFSKDLTTATTFHKPLGSSSQALAQFLLEQIALPPRPGVWVPLLDFVLLPPAVSRNVSL